MASRREFSLSGHSCVSLPEYYYLIFRTYWSNPPVAKTAGGQATYQKSGLLKDIITHPFYKDFLNGGDLDALAFIEPYEKTIERSKGGTFGMTESHGPYNINKLLPEHFATLSIPDAISDITKAVNIALASYPQDKKMQRKGLETIQKFMGQFSPSHSDCFKLDLDMDNDYLADFYSIGDFHEWIIVSRLHNTINWIVLAQD